MLSLLVIAIIAVNIVVQRKVHKLEMQDTFLVRQHSSFQIQSITKQIRSLLSSAQVRPEKPNRTTVFVMPKVFPSFAAPSKSKSVNDWEIKNRDIKLMEKVASGSFGDVYRGEWCGIQVAIKKPSKNIPEEFFAKFLEEVEVMTKLHHPNIVMFLGACIEEDKLAIVLEYLDRGCLFDFLRDPESEKVLSYRTILKFAVDIARGMKYLHQRCGIIQRDLKSRNLLLDNSLNVKLCDFGLSRALANENKNTMTACGTPYWTAPEIICGDAYNEKADVYSFAIVLWELITRDEPYDGRPGLEIAYQVAQDGIRPALPKFCPDKYLTLMTSCWDEKPDARPSFTELLDRLHDMAKAEKF